MVTRNDWAHSFLKWGNLPVTKHNLWALVAWEGAEGSALSHRTPQARWNPLNTTERMPGSTTFNWVGVQNYLNEEDGLNATMRTLRQPETYLRYAPILASLEQDALAKDTLLAVRASAWGTGALALRILSSVKNHWDEYGGYPIGQ